MKRFYVIVLSLLILFTLPIILWHLKPYKNLQVAIIDKTVPNELYKEHLGVTWLLNHLKYKDKSNNSYDLANDYFGFSPNVKLESYEVRSLPASYNEYDLIYLADTYGVDREDLPWLEKDKDTSSSEKVYGGLEEEEWANIVNWLNEKDNSLLIAEYNSFASPTKKAVRDSVTDYLGIDWSGWTGRYFEELNPEKNSEIPQWLVDTFGDTWEYSGEGFILVNDIEFEVVILEGEKHIKDGGISLSFTEEGEKRFGLTSSPDYFYWFDIVTPKDRATVLANYEWKLTDEGKTLLEKYGVPIEFAGVIASEHRSSSSYYFAGDFNKVSSMPSIYQIKGLEKINKIAQKFSDNSFYWSTYFPMMEVILENLERSITLPAEKNSDEIKYNARIENDSFEILKDNKWTSLNIKGVNIGMAKPGTFPGEAAITEEEYYRWFEYIGDMKSNTIRVYTLHPPGFYNALKQYNESHDEKIYVLHGVWINEEELVESLDAFEENNLQDFQEEMKRLVDVIHGNKIVESRPGHASGVYHADISEYVIGWILGIEWYPFMVENTNKIHASIGDYKGKYFETIDAAPFEYWLAEQMDIITQYEIENYQWIRPMSFTNWPTTDILDHPSDFTDQEDLVSVNPNVIYTKGEADLTKQFASYHIYPYYPDFLNYDEKYQSFVDHCGKYNNYAGYLDELHDSHGLPILVAEFGVPGSRGLAHENPFGWNQGYLSEQEQGEIISHLFEDIMEEKLLGGLVFTWQDEWFKRTWNTMDYDNPNRRPLWSNAQTNEQQFGLLSFDRHKIQVDGNTSEWEAASIYEKLEGDINALYVDHDERYLYIRLDYNKKGNAYPILLLDIIPDQGNEFIAGKEDLKFSNGVDFVINLNEDESRILVDEYYDFYTYLYAYHLELIEPLESIPAKNSGKFSKINYVLNKEYYLPDKDITIPFSSYETGKLKEGNGNPSSSEYDSLVDYSLNDEGGIELRIPWLLIQAKDPSQKEFMGALYTDGAEASRFIDQIYVGALYIDEEGKIRDSLPSIENNVLGHMSAYTWENWDMPIYEERLKESYFLIKDLFSRY
ncbi:hypothetical protein [Tissierella sp.]|uniref:hypothetical protein n=1 Tax=Tissierella sp. TaxID=41274 RepID=UPI0028579A30|nr:hypothetical protein [Tissierella sp.]MDR7855226.1 hypothetical protein [Tissierella sp.]